MTKKESSTLTEIAKSVAIPFYNDALSPAAKEVGNGLSALARIINKGVFLAEDCAASVEAVIRQAGAALLILPPERISFKNRSIALRVIEESVYAVDEDEMQEMFANLMASSLDTDSREYAHPAYIQLIKELSSDEAKILKYFSSLGGKVPILLVDCATLPGKHDRGLDEWSSLGDQCEFPGQLLCYIENLKRLSIVQRIDKGLFVDDHWYDSLLEERFRKYTVLQGAKYTRGTLALTNFGKQFVEVCIGTRLGPY